MTALPVPGAQEAELMSKVGAGVLRGLRRAGQLPDWPDTREGLLELHAILREWCASAQETGRQAQLLARARQDPSAGRPRATPTQLGGGGGSNAGPWYVERVVADSAAVLDGRVPTLVKLRPAGRRRAARRGLRAILGVYCPALLDQFEEAAASRVEWVRSHRKDFAGWFDPSRTDAEVARFVTEMEATKTALAAATEQLRDFIAANYPLSGS